MLKIHVENGTFLCFCTFFLSRILLDFFLSLTAFSFSEDLKLLSKIPLLPALLEGNEEERARLELCYDKNKLGSISLLDWISAKEPEQSLEDVVEICRSALDKVNSYLFSFLFFVKFLDVFAYKMIITNGLLIFFSCVM